MTNKVFITPNRRLSQQLRQQRVYQQASRQTVVTIPLVVSLGHWWQQLYQELLFLPTESSLFEYLPKRILSDFEAILLWEKVLQAECERQGVILMNTAATAKQLHEAWQLWAEWLLPEAPDGQKLQESVKQYDWQSTTPELILFQNCLLKYLDRLQQQGIWDGTLQFIEILSALKTLQKMPNAPVLPGLRVQNWLLYGFDEETPFLKQLLNGFESQGGQVQRHSTSVAPQQVALYTATEPTDEIRQAALWSVQQLVQALQSLDAEIQPTPPQITLVAPQVSDYASGFISALEASVLQLPEAVRQQLKQQWGLDHPATFYNVSLGEPMTACPLVQNALDTLQLFLLPWQSVDYTVWSRWLTSPFTDLGQVERGARHQLDVALRQLQWPHFKWPNLLKNASNIFEAFAPALKEALWQQLKQEKLDASLPISAKAFVQLVQSMLQQTGWSKGRNLDTIAYQQKQKFETVLQQFAQLYDIGISEQKGRSVQSWLSLLQRQLAETLFQVETLGSPPIQLMGILEAGGQTFDALWVLGMQDEVWPRPAKPNPFLPMPLQMKYHLPRSTAQKEHDYAVQVTQRLLNSAPVSVWSYAQQIGSAEYLISPLLQTEAFASAQRYEPLCYQTLLVHQQQQAAPLVYVVDDQAPEVAKGTTVTGGAGVLDAHRKCPLMAFLDYRLGARYGLQPVEEGIQANFQGQIVHEVLERFWLTHRTQGALLAMTDEALYDELAQRLDEALAPFQEQFAQHYLDLERSRLHQLIYDWLQLEKARPSFKVLHTEQEKEIEIAGLRFQIKVDRVDSIMGKILLLDYKTGKPTIKELMGETLKAPQLATYLFPDRNEVDQNDPPEKVAGLGYGQLNAEGVKFEVVVAEGSLLEGVSSIKDFAKEIEKIEQKAEKAREEGRIPSESYPMGANSWSLYLDNLKAAVTELVVEIQQGKAPMRYEDVKDLSYAKAQLALRVPESEAQKVQASRNTKDS